MILSVFVFFWWMNKLVDWLRHWWTLHQLFSLFSWYSIVLKEKVYVFSFRFLKKKKLYLAVGFASNQIHSFNSRWRSYFLGHSEEDPACDELDIEKREKNNTVNFLLLISMWSIRATSHQSCTIDMFNSSWSHTKRSITVFDSDIIVITDTPYYIFQLREIAMRFARINFTI